MNNDDVIAKIAKLKNVVVDVKVNEINGKNGQFLGSVSLNQFNPDKNVANGGPVTVKAVNVSELGDSYQNARLNALKVAAQLMGL